MTSNMLRQFKGSYEARVKKISKNKENIDVYIQGIKSNWGDLMSLHGILEEMFVEFIDIKEVAVWKAKIDRGQFSIDMFGKRFSLMAEYGFSK